ALWGMASVSLLVSLVFGPAARKFHRRHKLLAREQVYRVRQLAAKDPASAGLGLLHDVSPGLDRHSTAAGWTFALDTVGQVLADAEAEYPSPTFLGMTMDDNGEWSK
ncbi:MAG TPA: hypothetical protein VF516_30155, partial [Kofleriaceae bacterium]